MTITRALVRRAVERTRRADRPPRPPTHPWLVQALLAPAETKRQAWRDQALCAQVGDHDLWFPERGEDSRPAKRVCAACPVRAECLDYALDHEETRFGIWGGLSPQERRRLQARPTNRGAA